MLPGVHQVYVSGASGNVTAGKYNTGARENRAVLAGRLEAAMAGAWAATVRYPVLEIEASVEPFENGRGFSLRVWRAGKPRPKAG